MSQLLKVPLTTLLLCGLLEIMGCASALDERRQDSLNLLMSSGWQRHDIQTDTFALASWQPARQMASDRLRIYIEGDGLAWLNRSTPSFDPTPLNPLAFKLAMADPTGNAVYLARPCQFIDAVRDSHCAQRFWTSHRFSEEVIAAANSAIDDIVHRLGVKQIELVGFSGGGAVAVLVSARRDDVSRIVTIAGNLDHAHWTQRLNFSPLWGSMNPADVAEKTADIPQHHFVGGADKTLSSADVLSYQARFRAGHLSEVTIVDNFTHDCCWVDAWPEMLKR